MKKTKLLVFPLILGLLLMIYSWYVCYPLSIDPPDGFVFDQVAVLYWFSLPLTLASMFMIAVTTKSLYLKWVMAVGIVIVMYSLSFFYFLLPGSDSQYFRGVNEYFMKTRSLDPSNLPSTYFQWPSFFLLTYFTTSISGLSLANFEFLVYAIEGFLLASALYIYAATAFKKGAFVTVAVFFIGLFYFLNYQAGPYSLSLCILFLLFVLETRPKNASLTITMLILFASLSLTHILTPLIFILFLLVRFVIYRKKQYGSFFLLALSVYLLIESTIAVISFNSNIVRVFSVTPEYTTMAQNTLTTASVPIDAIAQTFSRIVTIAVIIICIVGFILLLIRKKMRDVDKAIFITGALISGLGFVLYFIGSRAIPILFFAVSLGASYLFESKFRRYLTFFLLILLMLYVFIPIHSSFRSEVQFQTKQDYQTENFLLDHYNWTKPSYILADFRASFYLYTKNPNYPLYENLFKSTEDYDTILYTLGLARYNYTIESLRQEEKINLIYSSDYSFIAVKFETPHP